MKKQFKCTECGTISIHYQCSYKCKGKHIERMNHKDIKKTRKGNYCKHKSNKPLMAEPEKVKEYADIRLAIDMLEEVESLEKENEILKEVLAQNGITIGEFAPSKKELA